MTFVLIAIAVIVVGALVFLVARRRARERRVVEIRRRELEGHRQEADAHERKAAELEEAVERHRRFAHRHEDAANEKQQEIENVGGGGFRLRSRG